MTSSWFLLLFLCLTIIISNFIQVSNATHLHKKKLPSAVVVGTVYCDTCFHQHFSKNTHFIPGASVEVECKDESSKPSFRQQVKTNEKGEFRVHLPFSVSKHVKRIKKCSVKLLNSSEPYCAVASTATSSLLRLKSRKEGIHIFSAGFFSFKPEKQPILCNEKPRIPQNPRTPSLIADNLPPFPPPLKDPVENNNFFLPPLPTLPPLPPLPPLPGIPFLPPVTGLPLPSPVQDLPPIPPFPGKNTEKATQELDKKVAQPNTFPFPPFFPPNPLQPPPLFPPILQPPPLFPPLLPPNPLMPPPAPLIPLPPIPFLTPPPPPPLIPSLPPFVPLPPFPPFPFPPSPPLVPGVPPASTSRQTSP